MLDADGSCACAFSQRIDALNSLSRHAPGPRMQGLLFYFFLDFFGFDGVFGVGFFGVGLGAAFFAAGFGSGLTAFSGFAPGTAAGAGASVFPLRPFLPAG